MNGCLITAQSVTQAQHMQRTLVLAGVSAQLVRRRRPISSQGCGFALQVRQIQLEQAVRILQREGFSPFRVYCPYGGEYQEVVI